MGVVNWQGLTVLSGEDWPGVRYFTTLRRCNNGSPNTEQLADDGFSHEPYASFNMGAHVGDDRQAVNANRQRLAQALPGEPVWLDQVHGTEVLDADSACLGGSVKVADAAVTSRAGRVLCIMTADCLPVVIGDLTGQVLGVAHAGWRGLAAGILEGTLSALQHRAAPGARWRAWIGPAIGCRAFEVGTEVRAAFVEHDAGAAAYFIPGVAPEKWQADLAGLAVRRLERLGVGQVQNSALCTVEHPDLFYSYRRDGTTGRMATVAWLEC